jgi:hypothetical protein
MSFKKSMVSGDYSSSLLQVLATLPHLSAKQVQDATMFLMDNANIYTVSDENHFKSTKVD